MNKVEIIERIIFDLAGRSPLFDEEIIESGLIDSVTVFEMISELEKQFGIDVGVDDLQINNFNSIESICLFLNQKHYGV